MPAASVVSAELFCPHCGDRLPGVPPGAVRCVTCRLIVGAGRGVDAATAAQINAGSAANTRGNAAKRDDAQPADPAKVLADLRHVAQQTDVSLQRLRLIDYDRHAAQDPDLVPLPSVLVTFSSWKQARAAAATS